MYSNYTFDTIYAWNCSFQYPNGTEIYWNDTDSTWQRCYCAAQTPGDPDIGGFGVLAGFFATAVITCIVAAVEWYCSKCQQLNRRLSKSGLENDATGWQNLAAQGAPEFPLWLDQYWTSATNSWCVERRNNYIQVVAFAMKFCKHDMAKTRKFAVSCLNSLCDIQVVTSLAIMVAALAHISTMAYYHQQLVMLYWFLTLNSFWAAKTGNFIEEDAEDDAQDDAEESSWHRWSRNAFVFISLILNTIFQIMVLPRWQSLYFWDPVQPGHCFISHDRSVFRQSYIWISGQILFATYLVCLAIHELIRHTSRWKDSVAAAKSALEWIKDSTGSALPGQEKFNQTTWLAYNIVMLILQEVFHLIKWLLWEWITLWSMGCSNSFVAILALFGFAAWNAYDIIDVKLSNRHLVTDEMAWGFGQVLPVVMLILVVLSFFDVAQEVYESESPAGSAISRRPTFRPEEGRELQALQSPRPSTESRAPLIPNNVPRRPEPEIGVSTGNVFSEDDLGEGRISRRSTRLGAL